MKPDAVRAQATAPSLTKSCDVLGSSQELSHRVLEI